jgi:hypothetical protein
MLSKSTRYNVYLTPRVSIFQTVHLYHNKITFYDNEQNNNDNCRSCSKILRTRQRRKMV